MNVVMDALREFAALVGQNWLIAAGAVFLVMAFDSAKPRAVEGEPEPHTNALERLAMILSLVSPFLLFLGAFGADTLARQGRGEGSPQEHGFLFALIIGFVLLLLAPGLLGWLIAATAPPLARLLRRLAPWLAIAAFAFTVYVTQQNAYYVLNLYVLGRLH